MITTDQLKEIEKLLAEDKYEIIYPVNKMCPAIYKKMCRKPGVPFFMSDVLKHETVSDAVIYLKNLYDQQ